MSDPFTDSNNLPTLDEILIAFPETVLLQIILQLNTLAIGTFNFVISQNFELLG